MTNKREAEYEGEKEKLLRRRKEEWGDVVCSVGCEGVFLKGGELAVLGGNRG